MLLRALLCVVVSLLVAAPAGAQEARRYDLERFRPAPDPDGFLGIPGTRTPGPWRYDVSLYTGYASEQLVLRAADGTRQVIVTDRATGDLLVQLGLFGIVAVTIETPVVLYQRTDGPTLDGGPALSAGAFRDPRITARVRLLGEDATRERDRHEGEGLAILGAVTVPIGTEHAFAGEGAPQLELAVLGDFHILDIGIGGFVGYRHRFAEPYVIDAPAYRNELRNQMELGVALQVPTFVIENLHSIAEVDVTTDLENPFAHASATVVEWRVGLRARFRDLAVTLAGGSGFVGGVGSPGFRGILGITWSPRVHDRDHDGIVDDRDECASLPEDFDSHEDENGCPEPDNDHDLVPDLDDRCPEEAPIGFDADDDGCTDPDSDGDGIADGEDACPAEPEDADEVEDTDGCIDPDNDHDGLPDVADVMCRDLPEDPDGFADGDGCPDTDDDADGIPDESDGCPRVAEDRNGTYDTDGCPESTIVIDDAAPIPPGAGGPPNE